MANDDNGSAFAGLGELGLVTRMHQQLDELLAARDQTERLLRVIVEIGSDLDLDATLRRIVHAAKDLTRAPYGALAVRDPGGVLTSFIHDGIDAATTERIGHLPVGKGVLSVSLLDTPVLRLDDLTKHPAAVGFPDHHPAMQAFIGVPITIRGAVFGNLYLTHDEPGRVFSESDEVAARALAVAAAVAIDNAQLFERERMSVKWMEASREITTALLSNAVSGVTPMQLIADRACALTGAEQAIVLIPDDADLSVEEIDTLVISAAVGLNAAEVIGQRIPVDASTSGRVFRSGEPVITESLSYPIQAFTDVGQRSAILLPLRTQDEVAGVIAVARSADRPPFDDSYLDVVRDFATHAALALMLTSAREHARRLTLVGERERIAHDLHDHVIQRLFATGMDLQGTVARARSPEVIERLNRTLDDLQTIIEEIRTTIFQLKSPAEHENSFRNRIQRVVTDLAANRDIVTTVRMHGPTTAVGGELADHAEAVTAEAVSNAVRHSGAARLTVEINVGDMLTLDIIDDGSGMSADNQRRSGLANMLYRAEQVGGPLCNFQRGNRRYARSLDRSAHHWLIRHSHHRLRDQWHRRGVQWPCPRVALRHRVGFRSAKRPQHGTRSRPRRRNGQSSGGRHRHVPIAGRPGDLVASHRQQ